MRFIGLWRGLRSIVVRKRNSRRAVQPRLVEARKKNSYEGTMRALTLNKDAAMAERRSKDVKEGALCISESCDRGCACRVMSSRMGRRMALHGRRNAEWLSDNATCTTEC
jgi:hypothetical protein